MQFLNLLNADSIKYIAAGFVFLTVGALAKSVRSSSLAMSISKPPNCAGSQIAHLIDVNRSVSVHQGKRSRITSL
jgi:hypothetical protein